MECNKEDCEALIHMLNTFIIQLRLDREVYTYTYITPPYSQSGQLVTCTYYSDAKFTSCTCTMLQDVSGMVERNRQNEVLLLYLRFFNILMSRKKLKQDDTKVVCLCVKYFNHHCTPHLFLPPSLPPPLFPTAILCIQYVVVCYSSHSSQ